MYYFAYRIDYISPEASLLAFKQRKSGEIAPLCYILSALI
nr:MAG TPA: hypothetical protein [Crassvirales sp.]